ncbi:MAG: T9SS type A sorting domain-containing protein [Bacteroidetes bacterium]|nr:T9SS type A sorting domain-containing protein [Bacteroidota bacterium]
MKNYYKKAIRISAPLRIPLAWAIALLLTFYSAGTQAQCTGCNSTISSNSSINVPAGQTYCLTYNGTYTRTIKLNAGSTICISANTTISSSATVTFLSTSGDIENYGTIAKAITLGSGFTINNYGTISATTTVSGGGLTNYAGGSITGGVTLSNANATFDNYGSFSGAFTATNGTATNYNGASFTPSGSTTFTAGSFTNNAGGTVDFNAMTVKNGYTFTNNGDFTATGLTVNSGGLVNLTGTSQTVNGNTTNNGTITMSGSMSVTGTYSDAVGATIQATGAGAQCNYLSIGTVNNFATNLGTFDGNNAGLTLSGAVPTNTLRLINGASGPPTAPAAPTAFSASVSNLVVSGSFSVASLATGSIVLRYIGASASSDVPADNIAYNVGDAVGSSTVVALPTGNILTPTSRSFTDNLPSSACGQNVYYTIFSYDGTQPCEVFSTSALTGSVTMTIPTATITPAGPTSFCAGSSVVLNAGGGVSYLWSTGDNTSSVTASTGGTYTVTATADNGCSAASSGQSVTVNTAGPITPYVNINGSGWTVNASPTLCPGGSIEFGPQPTSGSWSYSGPGGFTAFTRDTTLTNLQPSNSGSYIATYTDAGNGCSTTQTYNVTVSPYPTVNSPVICGGQSATLTATGGVSYRWTTGQTSNPISVSPAHSTIYGVTVTSAAGCTATATGTVWVNPAPAAAISASGPTTFCAPGSVTLTASGGGNYLWSTGATTSAITVSTSGTYTVTVTTPATGCTATASQVVTAGASPTASATSTTTCSHASATITASGGGTYLWSTGATTASLTIASPATTTTYTVTVTNAAGCTASASGTITEDSATATVTNPAVCEGNVATMRATGGGTYLWSTGSTTDTIQSLTAGVYSVTVTDAAGCSATTSGIITVNPIPTPSVNDTTICPGRTAKLTATGGSIYVWSTGATTTSITTSTAGTYTVTATNMGSCTATASGTVTVAANPAAAVNNGVICSGNPATLTATGGTSYVWSTGAITASISASTTGSYTVTVTNAATCTATATSTVTAASYPTATVNSPSMCVGTSATLTASGGVSYLWSTGATTASITVSPASTTTYSVTVTNAGGCTASAVSTVTVNALPAASATGGPICSGTAATLTASGGTSYVWSNSATTASTTTTVAGTYYVTVTNASGCTATASATATVAAKPTPAVTGGSACKNTNITMSATGGGTYLWNTGVTTSSFAVAPAATTTYTVTVTNAAGCTASASGTATVWALPTTTPSSNSPILLNSTINLTSGAAAGTSPYTYAWSGPSAYTSTTANPSIASAAPSKAGIYYLTVTDAHSCTVTGNTTVVLNFSSPGGVTSNTALWLYGDSVIASGSNVTGWWDASQLNNDVTAINGTAPTLVSSAINYHPAVNFNGTGGLTGSFLSSVTSTEATAFGVMNASSTAANASGIFSVAASATIDSTSNNSAAFFAKGANALYTYRTSAVRGQYSNANATGQYHMATTLFTTSASNKDSFFVEGKAQTIGGFTNSAFAATRYSVGERMGTTTFGRYLTGQIAEVALFNRQLTTTEKYQVESYLALKYGFTLDQTTAKNYIASNGTIFWNAASNGSYKNNIFGVGVDNVCALFQYQSVSINSNILSINGATGLPYYSFLMVSDNGSANTVSTATGLPNNINAKIAKVWRVSQTGTRTSMNFVYDKSSTNFGNYAAVSSSMNVYMIIDSNADGVYETYKAGTPSGSTISYNANLRDGALFSFGFQADIDYGDAWGVPTTSANNGAGHMIVAGVYLGSQIDAELDGQPSVNELGDDTIGVADEDGVNFNVGVPTTVNIVTMGTNTITVTASVAGYLNAWADLNQNNSYDGGSEYLIQNVHLNAGANILTFNVSDSVEYGPTSIRFRFATGSSDVTSATGLATNGEVEDYQIYVTAPLVEACTNGFQNPGFEMGPAPSSYTITSESNLPYWRTTAADKMIEMWKTGFNGVPSHGGTYFMELEANLYGALYQDVYTTPGTKLQWSFSHRGRSGADTAQLLIGPPQAPTLQATAMDGTSAWGTYTGFYTVPAGQYITRLQFTAVGSYGGNNSIGNFLDDVSVGSSFDYGDAPDTYHTLYANNGPYHSVSGSLYLGTGETCDADGQPGTAANADALDDGVTFPAACANCNTYTVSINAFNNSGQYATIAGWIDFNKNGVFDASERQSVRIPSSASTQVVSMTFTVNSFSSATPTTYARFRIANDSTQIANPTGLATSGEVEDYQISCVGMPFAIPTAPSTVCARGPMTLSASGNAPYYSWTGPNGYTSTSQNPTFSSVAFTDSGSYRVYAVYSNGCAIDSAVHVSVADCYVNLSGKMLDDANGNGLKDGVEITSNRGQTFYAVLSGSSNTVLASTAVAADGSFTFASVPAYTSSMKITPSTTNPAVGAATPSISWPTNWVGTKSQYGSNNNSGTGVYSTASQLPVSVSQTSVTNVYLGYDQLPSSLPKTYTIPKPAHYAAKAITAANGLGMFGGTDPEDGTFTAGSKFTITDLSGLNGNQLFYDANGDGTLQVYEEITGYTVITNVDPTKFTVKFSGTGSQSLTFNYASTDAAGKVDPAPAPYTIQWTFALPVKLISFTADKYEGTQSQLRWATASEINNDHFEIERSADGINWEKIAEVKGHGTTNEQQNYTTIDEKPMDGSNYYRLKQVDEDGKFEYSDIAVVNFDATATEHVNTTIMQVYPNPLASGRALNIALRESSDNIKQIVITNEMGQVVYTNDMQDQMQEYMVQGLDLAAGIYIVNVVSDANATFSGKIIVTQ